MTNFTAVAFFLLYGKLNSHLATHWNVSRGRKYSQKKIDVLLKI